MTKFGTIVVKIKEKYSEKNKIYSSKIKDGTKTFNKRNELKKSLES